MTALIVIGVIILIFAFLLNAKARAEIRFYGGELDFKVKYLCFTVFPLRKKKKKPKKRRERSKSERRGKSSEDTEEESLTIKNPAADRQKNVSTERADTENNGQESGSTDEAVDAENDGDTDFSGKDKDKNEKLGDKIEKLTDMIEKAKIIWGFSKKWLSHIFKHIYFRDLVIDFTVSGEDAYKAAMNYGSVSAVTYGGISALSTLFDTKIKTVDIVCDFNGKKSVFDGEVKITLSPGMALKAAFGILFGGLKNLKRLKGDAPAEEDELPETHTA